MLVVFWCWILSRGGHVSVHACRLSSHSMVSLCCSPCQSLSNDMCRQFQHPSPHLMVQGDYTSLCSGSYRIVSSLHWVRRPCYFVYLHSVIFTLGWRDHAILAVAPLWVLQSIPYFYLLSHSCILFSWPLHFWLTSLTLVYTILMTTPLLTHFSHRYSTMTHHSHILPLSQNSIYRTRYSL